MATSFDVNLNIGSSIGYNIVGRGRIYGLTPVQTTTLTLDGDIYASPGYTIETRKLSIAPLSDFISSPGNTSTIQAVYMTNNGTAVLTITDVLYSIVDGISPQFYFYSTATVVGSTITILPSATAQFRLSYLSYDSGEYAGYFVIESNNDSGYYKINTRQLISDTYDFEILPTSTSTTITKIGDNFTTTYALTAIVNDMLDPTQIVPIEYITITSGTGWYVDSAENNLISVRFNPNEINNTNGTYVSTLTITSNASTRYIANTATVSIDYSANMHLSSWVSPASYNNSIIGISYDLEENIRYLTIGVGMGGDGAPIYEDGGKVYADVNNLGPGAGTVGTPYAFWANVCRIPFTGAAQVYYSNDHVVKTTDGLNYNDYFGEYTAPGSMFVVSDDGYGSLTVEMNHLRELSTDTDLNATLNNLTRAFYYYSDVDTVGRYEPLPAEYSAPIDSNIGTTQMFVGFNYNTRDKLAFVNTSIVPLPT